MATAGMRENVIAAQLTRPVVEQTEGARRGELGFERVGFKIQRDVLTPNQGMSEVDLEVHVAFSHVAAAQWIAHGGPAFLSALV